tara:strand:+ start:166 stop:774 length:609 start_codon:yes stop_codon:yes gene_type:complete
MNINEFWTWFAQNERNIRIALSQHDKTPGNVIEHLFAKLDSFSPSITCEVRKCPDSKKYWLTISAWGNPDAYILVTSVVALSPKIPQWTIKAFIEPYKDIDELMSNPYTLYGLNIVPNTIYFSVCAADYDREIYDLILLLPLSVKSQPENLLQSYFYNLFLDLWGEIYITKRINKIQFTFCDNHQFYFIDFDAIGALDYFKT